MTHKVHPKIYRIRRINDWETRGYYKKTAEYLEEDFRIREFLKNKLKRVGIEKIEIERFPNKLNIIITTARPGIIIGRGGEGIEQLRKELEKKIINQKKTPFYILGKEKNFYREKTQKGPKGKKEKEEKELSAQKRKPQRKEIRIEIREIKNPWASASLSAQWIAQQVEKRVHHRRVIKQALGKILAGKEIKGARVEMSGRIDGSEIARRVWLAKGQLPRQTLRSIIDYAKAEAHCTYGVVGIKVWIYKGQKFE